MSNCIIGPHLLDPKVNFHGTSMITYHKVSVLRLLNFFFCSKLFCGLMSLSTIFQPCCDGAYTSWHLPRLWVLAPVGFKLLTYRAPIQNWLESMNAVQGLGLSLSTDITLIIDDPGLEQRCRGLIILVHSKLTVT